MDDRERTEARAAIRDFLAPDRARGDTRAVYGKKVLLRGPYVSQAYDACPFAPLP